MKEHLYQFRDMLRQEGVYLSFAGPVSQSLLEDIVGIIRQRMELEGVGHATIMSVFAVAVEQVQNMIKYSAETVPDEDTQAEFRFGVLVIGHEHGQYFVSSGNRIKNRDVDPLRARLTGLCQMTKKELKCQYKEQRKKPLKPGSPGAGLGLIAIARKACQPLVFEFQKIDDQYSFFSIKALIE
jgi:hypothetical protein